MKDNKYKFKLPKSVKKVLQALVDCGYEAYIVGGCVRDLILDIEPNDFDITTNATPQQIKGIFSKTIDTGIKHGTVTAVVDGECFEITTFRIDGKYLDCRHPESVTYTRNLSDDLLRRDFTINAMAYYDDVVDLFGGLEDLKSGLIRGVGDADKRFKEDALRMLRAIRFSARFGYEIEKLTKDAIVKNANLIKKVSVERIKVEIDKTLMSKNPNYFGIIYELGLLGYISVPLNKVFDDKSSRSYLLKLLSVIDDELFLKWTALSIKLSQSDAKKMFKNLKFDNKTMKKALTLLSYRDMEVPITEVLVRRLMSELDDLFSYFLKLKKAMCFVVKDERCLEQIRISTDIYNRVLVAGDATKINELKITGNDLIKIGYKGEKIGAFLKFALEKVIQNPLENDKEHLIELAKRIQ